MRPGFLERIFSGTNSRVIDFFMVYREFSYTYSELKERIEVHPEVLKVILKKLVKEEILDYKLKKYRLGNNAGYLIHFWDARMKKAMDRYIEKNKLR